MNLVSVQDSGSQCVYKAVAHTTWYHRFTTFKDKKVIFLTGKVEQHRTTHSPNNSAAAVPFWRTKGTGWCRRFLTLGMLGSTLLLFACAANVSTMLTILLYHLIRSHPLLGPTVCVTEPLDLGSLKPYLPKPKASPPRSSRNPMMPEVRWDLRLFVTTSRSPKEIFPQPSHGLCAPHIVEESGKLWIVPATITHSKRHSLFEAPVLDTFQLQLWEVILFIFTLMRWKVSWVYRKNGINSLKGFWVYIFLSVVRNQRFRSSQCCWCCPNWSGWWWRQSLGASASRPLP